MHQKTQFCLRIPMGRERGCRECSHRRVPTMSSVITSTTTTHGHLCAPGLGKGGINPQVWAHACRRVNCEQVMADTDKLNINSLNQWLLQMRRSKPHKDVWLQGDQKKRTMLKVPPNLSQSAHPTRTWSIAQNTDDTHRQYLDLSQLLEYGGFPLESKL